MPLQDHFHPPLHGPRDWHSFHHAWATYLAADINRRLPKGYFAEPNIKFGIEIDVAAFEPKDGDGVPPAEWTPPVPVLTAPFAVVTDVVEVKIYYDDGSYVLAGAIELVSPANKDRPDSRDAFVSKCAAYVQQGVGLVMVDIVTERHANLHDAFLNRLEIDTTSAGDTLYTTAYRPVEREGRPHLDVWFAPLTLGGVLPTMPLWLRGGVCIPLNLEAIYTLTCQEMRITVNGA